MKFKRITALLLTIITIAISANLFVNAQNDLPFTDVKSTDWFYNDVYLAYGRGLINGKSRDMFAPNDNLKYSEAVKLAACMRVAYFDEEPLEMSSKFWYEVYVDYCMIHGIIDKDYEWNAYVTRADFMEIFAAALPDNALKAINSVEDGSIPDVPMYHKNAEAIYKLYRAGIVQGSDGAHRCNPASQVKRSEVAAILTRMMYEFSRLKFNLYVQEENDNGGNVLTEEDFPDDRNDRDDQNDQDNKDTGKNQDKEEKPSEKPNNNTDNNPNIPEEEQKPTVNFPWEEEGAKQPSEYTYSEFQKLTVKQQQAFENTFGSMDAFNEWLEEAHAKEYENIDLPWNNGGKQPPEYTLEEYEALTGAQKIAFQNSFSNTEKFWEWHDKAQTDDIAANLPWNNGGKKPEEYTYAEYERLTAAQQMAFQKEIDFDAWLDRVQGGNAVGGGTTENDLPWENGGKKPEDYTYAEYERLTAAQQMAFQNAIDFDAWLEREQGGTQDGTTEEEMPWEKPGAKQPEDYTYAEFEKLTPAQQMAFQNAFDFDAWLEREQGGTTEEEMPWEKPGAKQPEDYTYEDFEDLTPAQQIAFQNAVDFDTWLERVQGGESSKDEMPWDMPGAKQPEDYTYEDFEALTAAQQIAFQSAFGTTYGFDEWLSENEPE